MAGLSDFAKGFFGDQLRQRQTAETMQAEDEQWTRRQKMLADLDVDTAQRKNKLERKTGRTYQDDMGNWVTEELDGGGNVVGTRKASAAEQASAKKPVLDVEDAEWSAGKRDQEWSMKEDEHKARMAESGERIRSSRWMRSQGAQSDGSGNGDGRALVSTFLRSDEGKLATRAYAEGKLGVENRGRDIPREKPSAMDEHRYRQELEQEIYSTLKATDPAKRPRTQAEFVQWLDEFMSERIGRLGRYQE